MQKIKTKWDPIRIQVPERVRKEEDMKTNYENAYINLFRFLYEDKKRSPLYYDPYRLGGDTIIRYDGSHDFRCYELVHEFVEEAQKSGINRRNRKNCKGTGRRRKKTRRRIERKNGRIKAKGNNG